MKTLSILVFILIFGISLSFSQQGALDPSFNPNDIGFGNGDGADGTVYTIAVQTDGKIIIGGYFSNYSGTSRQRIARLNSDGTLDESFNASTNDEIYAVGLQSTGKIIVAGNFHIFNDQFTTNIVRLNTDGTLDNTFNVTQGANNYIRCLTVQSDDKIVIGGNFTTFNGASRGRIARLNADGSLDTDFNPGSGASAVVNTIAIQTDGKYIIGGNFETFDGTSRNRIARLNSNGSLDPGFNPGTGFNGNVYALGIQSDGKIVAGGENITQYNGTSRNGIVRINTDGSVDGTFNTGSGTGTGTGQVYALDIQPDGKVIIGGVFIVYNGIAVNRICRLTDLGAFDATFDVGSGTNTAVRAIKILANNKVLIGGDFSSYNLIGKRGIISVNSDGSFDTAFNEGSGANNKANAIVLQNDGKIIIAGDFSLYNGHVCKFITRLNEDSSIDTNFDIGGGPNTLINAIALQDDGKIVIAGNFSTFNGISRNRIARLNADGSLDMSFDPGTGCNSGIRAVALQNDGKIIIVGFFTNYNGTPINRIARLNTNGSLDATFNVGTGLSSSVNSVIVQNDGKIIAAGSFGSYSGIARSRIARINTDGSIDNTFNPGIGANDYIYTITLQTDGKVLIGGGFTTYNGQSIKYVTRLNQDGSLDNSFNTGSGPNATVFTIGLQNDGKILLGGNFSTYNGTARNFITRINADGSIDNTFVVGSGTNGALYACAIQDDNKILISGNFTSYNDTGRNRIARIIGCTPTASFIQVDACETYTAPDGQIYTTSGMKTAVIPNAEGCDSTITIDLTIHQHYLFKEYDTICEVDTLLWRGKICTLQGTYYDSLLTQNGCDSVYVLYLTTIPAEIYYRDFDGDGFGDPDNFIYACSFPNAYVTNNLDCNDNNFFVNPTAYEVCDGIDNNCNGLTDANDPGLAKPLCEKQLGECEGAVKTASLCVGGSWLPCNDMAYSNHSSNYSNMDITCDNKDNDCDGTYDEDGESFLIQENIQTCEGSIISWRGHFYTESGVYWDSLHTQYGCDSVYALHLTVNPVFEFTQTESICLGGVFAWRGNNYSVAGTYYDSLITQYGCDSVYVLQLTVNPLPIVELTGLLSEYCNINQVFTIHGTPVGGSFSGAGVTGNNFNPSQAGSGIWPIVYCYADVNGCVSCDTVYVTVFEEVNPGTIGVDQTICYGQMPQIINGTPASGGDGNNPYWWEMSVDGGLTWITCPAPFETINYFPSPMSACYRRMIYSECTIVSSNITCITVNPTFEFTQNEEICFGDTFHWRGNDYQTTGTYYDSLSTQQGCDSVFVLHLTVNSVYEFTQSQVICQGTIFSWRGNNYSTTGIYYDSLLTANNCDSVFILNLTVNPSYVFDVYDTICYGDTLYWFGFFYYVPGVFSYNVYTQNNCDSMYIMHLSVKEKHQFIEYENICFGDTLQWRGNSYTTQGIYYDSLTTVYGCDSVYILHLSIHPNYEFIENATICNGGTYTWRGNSYTTQGIYYDSLTTIHGCDSVYLLNFTVHPTYEFTENAAICFGETYVWRGNNYTTQGMYYDSLVTINNCDSVFVLNLTINPFYYQIDAVSVCAGTSYFWHSQTYTLPGVYYDSLIAVTGCDSVWVLNLSYWSVYNYLTTDTICIGDTYYWRGNYYSTTGTYHESFTSQHGCDSVYTLHLHLRYLPVVSISGAQPLYCVYNAPVTLSASPVGGVFSGQGMSGSIFSPTTAGIGNWMIIYGYADTNGCFNADTVWVEVDACLGVAKHQSQKIQLYPNPNDGRFFIELYEDTHVLFYNALGAQIYSNELVKGTHLLDFPELPAGVYFLKTEGQKTRELVRVIVWR